MSDQKKSLNALIKRKEEKEAGAGEKPKRKAADSRKVKGFLIGLDYIRAFDVLKAETGKAGPELAEEALDLLFEKYGRDRLKD